MLSLVYCIVSCDNVLGNKFENPKFEDYIYLAQEKPKRAVNTCERRESMEQNEIRTGDDRKQG